jgi:hypothetical protein
MLHGVHPQLVARLRAYGAPFGLLLVVAYVSFLHGSERDLDLFEVFKGAGELTRQFKAAGLRGIGIDLQENELLHDMTSSLGFLHAVGLVALAYMRLV